jgi:hypothetical protein
VIEGLDHLQALGITCLYLNPIFSSAANYRNHAYDYFGLPEKVSTSPICQRDELEWPGAL